MNALEQLGKRDVVDGERHVAFSDFLHEIQPLFDSYRASVREHIKVTERIDRMIQRSEQIGGPILDESLEEGKGRDLETECLPFKLPVFTV